MCYTEGVNFLRSLQKNRRCVRRIFMYESRHFRSVARRALRGFWGLTIAVTLVASILLSLIHI